MKSQIKRSLKSFHALVQEIVENSHERFFTANAIKIIADLREIGVISEEAFQSNRQQLAKLYEFSMIKNRS